MREGLHTERTGMLHVHHDSELYNFLKKISFDKRHFYIQTSEGVFCGSLEKLGKDHRYVDYQLSRVEKVPDEVTAIDLSGHV